MNRSWIFILLAFALVIYLWVPTMLMLFEVEHEPEPEQISTTTKPEVTKRPLDENTIIAEHKPLGPPQEKGSAPSAEKEAILLEKIAVADKNLGLSLVGTVLADDPKMNIAVIDNRSTRQQERYHEGDRIGEVLVKRIFWDTVIIETERGEELLVMSFEGTAGGSLRSSRSSAKDSRISSLTDLEPTVSSGPLYGGPSSSVGGATRDGGNAAPGSGGSTSGRGTAVTGGSGAGMDSGGSTLRRGTAATYSGGSLSSSSSSSEDSSSSSPESEEGDSSLTDPEPSVSSGPLL
jgi:hypothetical protein